MPETGDYRVRGSDIRDAVRVLNTPGFTLGDCRDVLRTIVGFAEELKDA